MRSLGLALVSTAALCGAGSTGTQIATPLQELGPTWDTIGWAQAEVQLGSRRPSGARRPEDACGSFAASSQRFLRATDLSGMAAALAGQRVGGIVVLSQMYYYLDGDVSAGQAATRGERAAARTRSDYVYDVVAGCDFEPPGSAQHDYVVRLRFGDGSTAEILGREPVVGSFTSVKGRRLEDWVGQGRYAKRRIEAVYLLADMASGPSDVSATVESLMNRCGLDLTYHIPRFVEIACHESLQATARTSDSGVAGVDTQKTAAAPGPSVAMPADSGKSEQDSTAPAGEPAPSGAMDADTAVLPDTVHTASVDSAHDGVSSTPSVGRPSSLSRDVAAAGGPDTSGPRTLSLEKHVADVDVSRTEARLGLIVYLAASAANYALRPFVESLDLREGAGAILLLPSLVTLGARVGGVATSCLGASNEGKVGGCAREGKICHWCLFVAGLVTATASTAFDLASSAHANAGLALAATAFEVGSDVLWSTACGMCVADAANVQGRAGSVQVAPQLGPRSAIGLSVRLGY